MNHRINMYIDLNTKEVSEKSSLFDDYYMISDNSHDIIRLHIISLDRGKITEFVNKLNNVKLNKERYYNLEHKSKYEHTIESHKVETFYTIILNKLKIFNNKRLYDKMFSIFKIYGYNIYDDVETFNKNYYAEAEFRIIEDTIDEII